MGTAAGSKGQINVTPLIDVLLVLLIIFMVIIPQRSDGLSARIPQAATGPDSSGPRNTWSNDVVISVDEDRTLKINTQRVEWVDLEQRLHEIFARRPNGVLFVAGARRAEFDDIARVIDTARGAGISHVALMPRRPDPR